MKYIQTYENRFTDLFKSKEYDVWDLYMQSHLNEIDKYTTLMFCADDGDIKKFKNYFKEHIPNQVDNYNNNTLIHVPTGKGSLRNKKEMIRMLIDAGEDPFKKNIDGYNFIDRIKEPELKKWLLETYPDIEVQVNANKYNL